MKKLLIGFAVIAISLSIFVGSQKSANQLYAEDPYIRAVAPGQDRTAGFVTLINPTETDCQLISATADFANSVEFHNHQHINNMVMMRPVDSIEVPAGAVVSLQPGGLHLMLFNVQLTGAESTQISLQTDQCGTLTFSAPMVHMGAEHKEAMHH